MDLLQKLINQQPSSSTSIIGTGSLTYKGNFLNALSATREKISQRIVDSGASDQMTRDARTYSPCHRNFYIKIADGSLSRVTGTGTGFVVISMNLTLNSVFLVPNLDCNLFSINKLTHELNCVSKFFPYSCDFQDLNSEKMIGNAKMCSGLYILNVADLPEQKTHIAYLTKSNN